MAKLLMITGDRALAEGKHGAFYNTLEEFHKHWERIDIITPGTSKSAEITGLFGNVFIHPSPWPLIFQPLWILTKGKRIYKEQKFDLITSNEYPPFYNGIGTRLLWQKISVPYVLEIMHIPGHPRAANLKERFYKFLVKRFIKSDSDKSKAVRIINQKETPNFLIKAGISKDKMHYIPAFYIDLETFRPVSLEKKYDLVYVARLEKNKGIFNLIDAIKIAKYSKPDIRLLIIGNGSQLKNLKFKIENLKLEENVVFSGWLETHGDVALAYNSAKCFINPSYNEGGPRVVLEAMACGLPVVTTRVGLMHDIIEDGQNGLFVDWGPADISAKMLTLLKNTDMQNSFSIAGLELVKQFEKKTAIENYAKRLQTLI